MNDTLLFHVQHFQGMGHLIRAFALAEALATRFDVVVASGGSLPPGLDLPIGAETVRLPALGFDDNKQLVSEPGTDIDVVVAERRQMLLHLYDRVSPAVVLTELFPFGRKKLAPELLPLLTKARLDPRKPVIACSIRDLLVTGRHDQPRHDARAASTLNEFFDLVVMHCDPGFARLEDSFSPALPISVPIEYTGFIARPQSSAPVPAEVTPGSVVVSAGGGWVGGALMFAAAEASAMIWGRHGLPMTLIAGPLVDDAARIVLEAKTSGNPNLTVVGSVPDLLVTLRHAAVSISQCGYNTALDLVRSRVPAVLVPFGDESENEQPRRAQKLAALGLGVVVTPNTVTATTLADAVTAALRLPTSDLGWSMDGAKTTTRVLGSYACRLCQKEAS